MYTRANDQISFLVNGNYRYTPTPGLSASTSLGVQGFDRRLRTFDVANQDFATNLIDDIGSGALAQGADEFFVNLRQIGIIAEQEVDVQRHVLRDRRRPQRLRLDDRRRRPERVLPVGPRLRPARPVRGRPGPVLDLQVPRRLRRERPAPGLVRPHRHPVRRRGRRRRRRGVRVPDRERGHRARARDRVRDRDRPRDRQPRLDRGHVLQPERRGVHLRPPARALDGAHRHPRADQRRRDLAPGRRARHQRDGGPDPELRARPRDHRELPGQRGPVRRVRQRREPAAQPVRRVRRQRDQAGPAPRRVLHDPRQRGHVQRRRRLHRRRHRRPGRRRRRAARPRLRRRGQPVRPGPPVRQVQRVLHGQRHAVPGLHHLRPGRLGHGALGVQQHRPVPVPVRELHPAERPRRPARASRPRTADDGTVDAGEFPDLEPGHPGVHRRGQRVRPYGPALPEQLYPGGRLPQAPGAHGPVQPSVA